MQRPAPSRHASLIVPTVCCLALAICVLGAGLIPDHLLAPIFGAPLKAAAATQPHWIDRFFAWDSDWYDSIARQGYSWHPGSTAADNIAFFPLWPLLLRAIATLAGNGPAGRICTVLVTTALGLASIFAVHSLARATLPPTPARWAVAFYALNPAANFLFRSYPVGLINLLAALCLHALLQRRYWQATIISGLASAAGPLAACLSLTVIIAAAADPRAPKRRALPLAAIAALSLWGLLAFSAWSLHTFGNPTPFIAAQSGWETPLPFLQRCRIALKLALILPDLSQAARALHDTASLVAQSRGPEAETRLQNAIGYITLATSLVASLSCLRLPQRCLACLPLLVAAAYIWLVATNLGAYATPRLLYPALPSCLGLALLCRNRRILSAAILLLSGATLITEEYLTLAGYWVI